MATYKVIQDIEAEDKLLGPLTLRQFIYAAIVIVSGFIAFKVAMVAWWAAILFLPHMVFFAILAAPFGHDQSSEVWLLAKIRFALKPRRRVWDQSGLKQLVQITVPKKIERQLTNGLSQTEVKSRLEALANTIDSRGWAVKNVNVNLFSQPSYVGAYGGLSDRLIDPNTIPQEVPNYDTQAVNDVMDGQTAQHFDQLINQSTQNRREQLMATMQQTPVTTTTQAAAPANYWFMNETPQPTAPGQAAFASAPVVTPGYPTAPVPAPTVPVPVIDAASEAALLEQIHEAHDKPNPTRGHLKTIKTLDQQREEAQKIAAQKAAAAPPPPVTPPANPAILQLAKNDDLNIATIARQANIAKQGDDGEVVISLR